MWSGHTHFHSKITIFIAHLCDKVPLNLVWNLLNYFNKLEFLRNQLYIHWLKFKDQVKDLLEITRRKSSHNKFSNDFYYEDASSPAATWALKSNQIISYYLNFRKEIQNKFQGFKKPIRNSKIKKKSNCLHSIYF